MGPLNDKFALGAMKEIRQDLYGQCGIESLAAALGVPADTCGIRTGCDDARQSAPRIWYTDVDPNWLLTGEGERSISPPLPVWIAAYQKSPLV